MDAASKATSLRMVKSGIRASSPGERCDASTVIAKYVEYFNICTKKKKRKVNFYFFTFYSGWESEMQAEEVHQNEMQWWVDTESIIHDI